MKKILSVLLSLALVTLAMGSLSAFADAPADHVGYAAVRVEEKELAGVANILDYENNTDAVEYKITNARGLVHFSELVRDMEVFLGKTVYLANDIDMSGVEDFLPIGYNDRAYFSGCFDGQGHVIDNLVLNSVEKGFLSGQDRVIYIGLFGYIAEGAVIKNVILGQGCLFTYFGGARISYVAGLCGGMRSTAGKTVTIDNCQSMARVQGIHTAAGIVACVEGNPTGNANVIKNTTNTGSVINAGVVAGFAASVSGKLQIENCRNTGEITLNLKRGSVELSGAGFVAKPEKAGAVSLLNCINNGVIQGPDYIGAFFGSVAFADMSASNCTNYGSINAGRDRGGAHSGVLGNIENGITVTSEKVNNKEGGVDATLSQMDKITPDFTVNEESTTPPLQTELGTTEPGDDKGGCASAVGAAASLALLGVACSLCKKKGA